MKHSNQIHYFVLALLIGFLTSCGQQQKTSTENAVAKAVPQEKGELPHWGYKGKKGPETWGSLGAVYATCGTGTHQSPINIDEMEAKGSLGLELNYKTTALHIAHNEHVNEIINNGHTIQVTVDEGSTLNYGGKSYHLVQFHFHTPSEHTVNGKNLPMEMHLVHQSDDKSLAVVSVLFEEGDTPNENIDKLIAHLPDAPGDELKFDDKTLDITAHIPEHEAVYHYIGSLTTPPCSEDVEWFVLGNRVKVTPEQVKAFSSRIGKNNRPVQPLNDRSVTMQEVDEDYNQ
jgi:carbonic anhydrase